MINGFTTRVILEEGEKVTDESQIKVGDLTEDGFKFYASESENGVKSMIVLKIKIKL